MNRGGDAAHRPALTQFALDPLGRNVELSSLVFTIRKAAVQDAEAACIVLRRSITECCEEDHAGDPAVIQRWLANKTPEALRSWFLSPGYAVVAERNRAVVGTALLGQDGTIALCYLVPEARYQGIGKAMLQTLESEARRRSRKQIELSSTKSAYRFYLRNGYRDTGRAESFLGLTALVLQKELTEEVH